MAYEPVPTGQGDNSRGGLLDVVLGFVGLLFTFLWSVIAGIWYWASFLLIAILALPGMWIMAYLYPTWEKWIKENTDWRKKYWERFVLIIPFSIIMGLGMILYHIFHPMFEARIKDRFGLKSF